MGSQTDSLKERLKEKLKEIFQFESEDLDFGIYRIMNYKRKEIENFIEKELIEAVKNQLQLLGEEENQKVKEDFEKIRQRVREAFGEDAFEDEDLKESFRNTPLGKEYYEKKEQLEKIKISEDLERAIYNHLINFFSRYYDNGDFISKRRYGKREKYVIPYNGEEVLLYWVNKDQYYIKTTEYFRRYTFWDRGKFLKVNFRIVEAEEEKGNTKAQEKKFFVLNEKVFDFDEEGKELNIYFEYRALTGEEKEKYGNQKVQEKINEEIIKTLEKQIPQNSLARLIFEKDGEKTLIEKHLYKYTRRNTTDYFIHKDLKGFLERELDFYIKNEFLQLEDLQVLEQSGYFDKLRLYLIGVRVFRNIALKIIEFLAQIENFQKKLWEKKKFVIDTHYVITLDKIKEYAGEEFLESILDEILNNEKQLSEWKELFGIKVGGKDDLLSNSGELQLNGKEWRKLPIDTKYFDEEFKWKLLVALSENNDLDEILDGVLIKSENWQALNLLMNKYKRSIKTIYIDPPYNTGNDGFLYKDNYQHSSWLAMMHNRLRMAKELMQEDGVIFVSIDDNELYNLKSICEYIFPYFIGNLIWQTKKGGGQAKKLYLGHEYILTFSNCSRVSLTMLNVNYEKHLENIRRGRIEKYVFRNGKWYFINDDVIRKVHGKYKKGEERRLEYEDIEKYKGSDKKKEVDEKLKSGEYILIPSGTNPNKHYVARLDPIDYRQLVYSIIQGHLSEKAKEDFFAIFGIEPSQEEYYKPMSFVKFLLESNSDNFSVILDFFAGSGTTAHAVMKLNKEDRGKRKFILIEMADYFDTVIIPRIKKVAYSFNWREGKPQDTDGIGVFFKYHTLEQYEDALENIRFELQNGEQQELLLEFPDYFVKYMLEWETKGSRTFLQIAELKDPFNYKLKIIKNYQPKDVNVDLVETFNYLLGLHIKGYKVLEGNGRKYVFVFGGKGGKRIAIVWRSVKDIDFEEDKKIIENTVRDFNPDEIYINGEALVKGFRHIEPLFKSLMFEEVG